MFLFVCIISVIIRIESKRNTLMKEIVGNERDYDDKRIQQEEENYEDNIINEDNILRIPVFCEIILTNHQTKHILCVLHYDILLSIYRKHRERVQERHT